MTVDAHTDAAVSRPTVENATAETVRAATAAAYRVHRILREHPGAETVALRFSDSDKDLTVPRHAAELLMRILSSMAAGKPVSVIPDHAELTTQQAADLMNVSRPHVIKLLDEQKIQYRMVGTHRRVSAASVREYLDGRTTRQRQAADELTALTYEMDFH